MYDIAVDIGGTFTDCVVHDVERERIMAAKAPSRRDDLGGGVLDSVRAAAERLGVPLADVLASTRRFIHGSTVATNAMIERDGAQTAYVTTAGHEDTLAIGKIFQKRAGLSEREISHLNRLSMADPPLVPRELVFGALERVDYRGRVVIELGDEEIAATIERVRESGAEAVAICLLWSFLEPAHERRLAAAMRAALPGVYVSASIDVAPVFGEYERGVTTALNAYLGPPISRYLGGLQELLSASGLAGAGPADDGRGRRRLDRQRPRPPGQPARLGPGRRHARLALLRSRLRRAGHHLHRRRRHLLRRLAGDRRRAAARARAGDRPVRVQDPQGRGQVDRRRRRLDRLGRPARRAQGRPAVGRRPARPRLLRPRRHACRRSPTPT